ncbi:M6 family metalloprotease domain-containing protein [Streptomyces sp. DH12]|uniref:M6 family metalloprotease domain-containing protein n=1 Tax=Streptomyces sp. DH12 TaxID=2857010 RepID=UPI001E558D6A|nr:M6 family metalloprotease domain-containing protein [Streptomyces sp. DH12]
MTFRISHPEVDVQGQQPPAQPPGGVHRPSLRSTAAGVFSLIAIAATGLAAGPVAAVPSTGPCALPRTDAHHSLGLDTWNTAYPRPDRSLDAVMLFLSFPDATPAHGTEVIAADHFPGTSEFFARASYGRFALRAEPRHGWLRMPRPSTAYAVRRDWAPDRRAAYLRDALAVADPVVDFSRYDIVYLVADPDAPGVDSDATKVVNLRTPLRADGTDIDRVVTVFERHPPDRNVLAHETGHVFDLPDLYNRPVDGKGDWDTHVGDWDVMGSQFAMAPEPFGWHKWKLGWLDEPQVRCVRTPQWVTLRPLAGGHGPQEAASEGAGPDGADPVGTGSGGTGPGGTDAGGAGPGGAGAEGAGAGAGGTGAGAGAGAGAAAPYGPGPGAGTRLAVVRTGRDRVLAVEARGALGNDSGTCAEGVLVYRVRAGAESGAGPVEVVDAHPLTAACRDRSVYPPLADAPLGEGESFTVPGEGVRVQVGRRTPAGDWTVRIAP